MAISTVVYDDNGVDLIGSIDTPIQPSGHVMLLLHGFTGHRLELAYYFVDLARRLNALGVTVYRFDFRGCGESGGLFDAITVADQVRQTHRLLEFVRARHPVMRLHLTGFSMGALVASLVAAELADDDLVTLSLLAPAGNLADVIARSCAAGSPLRDGRYDLLALPIGLPLQREAAELDPWTPLTHITVPTLVVHGGDDAAVPVEIGRRYASAIAGAHWVEVAGADHVFGSMAARDALVDALRQRLGL
ncbi:alpha/beta hydrolase [Chitinolyticbacter albus]|uniref:alpha/beta hydrolase n=1 Tax=Chitinolyticbacter albus TaxID=2961951 RepID=UPI00210D5407|nr:alpha/beta fold hydrolase [Chitinolyticbacter albus]